MILLLRFILLLSVALQLQYSGYSINYIFIDMNLYLQDYLNLDARGLDIINKKMFCRITFLKLFSKMLY